MEHFTGTALQLSMNYNVLPHAYQGIWRRNYPFTLGVFEAG